VTDAWVGANNPLGLFHRHLRERYHSELAGAAVRAWTAGLVAFELAARVRRVSGWPLVLARNDWFQSRVARHLASLPGNRDRGGTPILFSYSYTALAPFRVAKQRGWITLLGQIDPGPSEERIVAELHRRCPEHARGWQPAPAEYWAAWQKECELADVVIVNSDWSRDALLVEGLPEEKIAVVPLAYTPPPETHGRHRTYPATFSRQRPLRVLFLGQAIVRKGIHDLIAAAQLMEADPIVFDVVGGHGPLSCRPPRNLTFHGPVPRGEVSRWYEKADLFLLPSHSDGFALTQLEAMAHGLPVMATPRCGAVVEQGRTGWVVQPGNPRQLADVLREAISTPSLLSQMSALAVARVGDFSTVRLGQRLVQLTASLGTVPFSI
jgi:glycosyltransferase involved in cell wall biosynthesis